MGSLLDQQTLVLNRSWIAIATTRVRSAITMIFNNAAKVVDPETYQIYTFNDWKDFSEDQFEGNPFLRGASFKFIVPEVILLQKYNKVPQQKIPFTRKNLFLRDSYACQYCGAMPGTSELTIDHVLPRSRGGETSWENCVLSCVNCNMKKGNRIPKELGWSLKTEPKSPHWTPAFKAKKVKLLDSWQRFIDIAYWNIELKD